MTQTKILILTVFALIAGIVLGAAVTSAAQQLTTDRTAEEQQTDAAAWVEPEMNRIDITPAALGEAQGTETLSPAQALEVSYAADRVCEGLTAQVPVMVLADTVAAEQGLTDEEARAFVNRVALERC